jgi:molecular chaperone IbpA
MLLKEDMVMRLMDFAPLTRSSIGFDRLFDMIDNATQYEQADAYPPYNIERTGENAYRITLAVAGFEPDELHITSQANQLIVAGKKAQTAGGEFLYQGIAGRAFQRQFSLADYVRVTGANLHNGMLSVDLAREVPEAAKPRRIDIGNGGSGRQQIESKAA